MSKKDYSVELGETVALPDIRLYLAGAALLFAAACSTPDSPGEMNDPYERVNRWVHNSNKASDRLFIRPASQAYGTIVPEPIRRSLSNAANNLNGPRSVANDVLQGNLEDAGHNMARFFVNTTIGVFGLFDPASGSFGLESRETGFADTLAVWGVREGAYLELPVFGPSTERDALGLVVDIATNPVGSVLEQGDDIAAATSIPSVLNSRYELSDTVDSILYDSADSYAQLRLFYLESRRFQLSGEQGGAENAYDPYENLYDEVYGELYEEF